jgi:hypothetical protein
MKRKAIVLLMTIGFIALISALVLISISISKRSFDEVVYLDARNQFNVVFKDFVKMLDTNTKKIKTSTDLDTLLGFFMPAMKEPKTGIEFGFDLESKMGKLNLNYLLVSIVEDENDENRTILELPFDKYFSKISLKEPRLLIDMLLDTIDKDDLERGSYSEIASEDYDFTQGKIYGFSHLKKIFDHYYEASKDSNIYKIDRDLWEESFYFGDVNRSKQAFDCENAELETLNLMVDNEILDQDRFCQQFDKPKDAYLIKLKDIYNFSDFNKTNQYLIQCNIIFNSENFNRNVRFDYDIKTGKVDNIDKNFQE